MARWPFSAATLLLQSPGTQASKPKIPPTVSLLGLSLLPLRLVSPLSYQGADPMTSKDPAALNYTVLSSQSPGGPSQVEERQKPACLPSRTLAGPQVPVLSGSCSSGLHAPGGSPSGSNTSHIWDTQRVSPQCVSCWEKPWGMEAEWTRRTPS